MKRSIKQLLRTPGKAVLFFLLIASCSLLLVAGAVMLSESSQKIAAAEGMFVTVGTVEQPPISNRVEITPDACLESITRTYDLYGENIPCSVLDFEGAEYVAGPENRPYYVSYLPQIAPARDIFGGLPHIVEFTPLESCVPESTLDVKPIEVRIEKVLFSNVRSFQRETDILGGSEKDLQEGDIIPFCQHADSVPQTLELGKKYIASIRYQSLCPKHNIYEYILYMGPYSSQYAGEITDFSNVTTKRIDEVTPDFYETDQGKQWLQWASFLQDDVESHLFYVLPTNSLNLLPSFYQGKAYIAEGRAMTEEEFENGALVCMLPKALAAKNFLQIGDKVSLPLLCALYGLELYDANPDATGTFSLLDANGEMYEPFWTAEYEIVGTYSLANEGSLGAGELADDMILIPMKSVGASDEKNIAYFKPMNELTASFQIPNGTMEEFDKALREAVPQAAQLAISYDDMGYSKIMESLQSTKDTAILLCVIGLLAVLTILALLLYFFVVKQKKRTAIERSLGMSKKQCYISLLTGLLVLTLTAAAAGSLGAAVFLEKTSAPQQQTTIASVELEESETATIDGFSTKYSLWANKDETAVSDEFETLGIAAFYFGVPILLFLLVLLLSLVLINRNLTIEPILLLSGKLE